MKKTCNIFMPVILILVLILTSCADSPNLEEVDQENLPLVTPVSNENISNSSAGSGSQVKTELEEQIDEIKWVRMRSTEQGFSLQHPEDYVVEENVSDLESMKPQPDYEVNFFNNEDAVGIQPAVLVVRVYELSEDFHLESWLEDNQFLQRYGSSADLAPYSLGKMEAFKITSKQLITPNFGVYAAHPRHKLIYELIPADLVGEKMLESFSVVEFR